MTSYFHYALYAIMFAYLQDFIVIRFIYRPPTDAIAAATKGYFPTYYMYYYNLTELQDLATALKDAKETGHGNWLESAIGFTLFVRQILPMSGLYYVEILTGHVYGFLAGLCITWKFEVSGAMACYLLSTFARLCLWSQTAHLWKYLQIAIAFLDGSTRSERALGIDPSYTSVRTRIISAFLLSFLRSLALVPNWLFNSVAVELGVPFAEFLAAVILGAFPHLFCSVYLGTRLLELTETVESSFCFFYIMVGIWNVIQVVLSVIILLWYQTNGADKVDTPVEHKTPSAISQKTQAS